MNVFGTLFAMLPFSRSHSGDRHSAPKLKPPLKNTRANHETRKKKEKMGTSEWTKCILLPDGTFKVKFYFSTWCSGDQVGPEFDFDRVDTGTFKEIAADRFQFTITQSAIQDSDKVNSSPESVVGSVLYVTVGADGVLSGYPEQRLAWGGLLAAPTVTQENF
jgi:hypothetical protein